MNTRILAAVIPVRAGSRRLKNKNIAPFAGTTLLQYKIQQL
jgi:N-acylneuraminate cytidylyltransferase